MKKALGLRVRGINSYGDTMRVLQISGALIDPYASLVMISVSPRFVYSYSNKNLKLFPTSLSALYAFFTYRRLSSIHEGSLSFQFGACEYGFPKFPRESSG
jgi:hypothetical protein